MFNSIKKFSKKKKKNERVTFTFLNKTGNINEGNITQDIHKKQKSVTRKSWYRGGICQERHFYPVK